MAELDGLDDHSSPSAKGVLQVHRSSGGAKAFVACPESHLKGRHLSLIAPTDLHKAMCIAVRVSRS